WLQYGKRLRGCPQSGDAGNNRGGSDGHRAPANANADPAAGGQFARPMVRIGKHAHQTRIPLALMCRLGRVNPAVAPDTGKSLGIDARFDFAPRAAHRRLVGREWRSRQYSLLRMSRAAEILTAEIGGQLPIVGQTHLLFFRIDNLDARLRRTLAG